MSIGEDTKPQDVEPDRLKPDQGTDTLRASVEATAGASDLCTPPPAATRARILVWLAEGARQVTWALCSLPRERWVTPPPARLSDWPALRHARHLALRETHLTLPAVRQVLNESSPAPSIREFEQADAAWDPVAANESAEAIVQGLGVSRLELLQRLETAPDDARELDWLLLSAHQHELEHLAAIWKLALNWDGSPHIPIPGVPLHPADRLEESH